MRRKIPWFILSILMALSLVLASCGPAETEEEEEEEEEEEVIVPGEEEEEEPPTGENWWDKGRCAGCSLRGGLCLRSGGPGAAPGCFPR